MVTRTDIENEVNGYLKALSELGFIFQKAYFFGSYIRGNPHQYSDIDLAVWSDKFDEDYFSIIEKVAHLRRTFKNIELHPFIPEDNYENNPFIREIENTGILITPAEEFRFSQVDTKKAMNNSRV